MSQFAECFIAHIYLEMCVGDHKNSWEATQWQSHYQNDKELVKTMPSSTMGRSVLENGIKVRRAVWGIACSMGKNYPTLSPVARRLLSLHATSCAPEKNWSQWGTMYRKDRSSLAFRRAEKLIAVSSAARYVFQPNNIDHLHSDVALSLCMTLLTEEVAKFESKYTGSHFSASFHNFIGASNHPAEQLLKMDEGDRRYALINTCKFNYTKEQWAALWSRDKNDTIRELFWQFLRARHVSHVQPGTAPMNKAKAIAGQAPDTIRYLKHLSRIRPDDLQPRDTLPLFGSNSRALPMAINQHEGCLKLKDWPQDRPSPAMTKW